MKKRLYIVLLAALSALTARAQHQADRQDGQDSGRVQCREVQIVRTDQTVDISFEVATGRKSVGTHERLILTPVLYNDSLNVTLPPIVVQSRHAQWQELRTGTCPITATHRMGNLGRMQYRVQLPDSARLERVFLRLERVLVSCCNDSHLPAIRLTEHAALVPLPSMPYVPHPQPLEYYTLSLPITSVADSMARHYSFVAPMSDFATSQQPSEKQLFRADMPLNMTEENSPQPELDAVERFIANNEKGAMQINFDRGSSQIYRYYRTNNASLVALASVLQTIQGSANSQVEKIVIAGFASPEGPLERNDRLARERAAAMRHFVLANSTIALPKIQLYNGSEDWQGLRRMILESDMEHKEKLLDIIDRVPIKTGREGQLMRVDGGRAYQHLARNFFPQLRNAAYIKVYFGTSPVIETASQELRKAWALMQDGKYAPAAELLKACTHLPGGGVENLMGVCSIMLRNYDQAREYLKQAIGKGNAEAETNLSHITRK